jgi:hypothetical protein
MEHTIPCARGHIANIQASCLVGDQGGSSGSASLEAQKTKRYQVQVYFPMTSPPCILT